MRQAWLVVVLLALLLATPAPAAVAAGSLDGQLRTSHPGVLTGTAASQDASSLQAFLGEQGVAGLSAEQVSVRTEWEEGQRVDAEAGSYRQVEDQGVDEAELTRVNASFEALSARAQIFVVPSPGFLGASGTAEGPSRAEVLPADTRLARAGYTGASAGAGNDSAPGFQHRTEAPLVVHRGLDAATVTGSFQVFVNNITIQASSEDGGFEDWAGYRESASAPSVHDYALRVTVIDVQEGRLTVPDAQQLSLLGEAISLRLEGAVSFAQARGELRTGGAQTLFSDEPLTLRGAGQLDLSVQDVQPEPDPLLGAEVDGSFAVVEGPDGLASQTEGSPMAGLLPTWGWIAAGLAGLLCLALFAGRHPALLRPLPARARRPLFDRWQRQGRRREDERAFAAAAESYEKARALYPSKPVAWYRKARALLEAGHDAEVANTVDEAGERLDVVPLDLLEIKVAAAWRAGEETEAREALSQIADRSTAVARGLVRDLELTLPVDDPLRDELSDDDQEGLRGYV